jgi:hypothetical protein
VDLLSTLLARISFVTATPAVIGAFVTAGVLVVSRDWRLNLLALAGQYLFVGVLMTQVIRLEMAAVKALIGWLICLVFYLTEQQAGALERGPSAGTGPSIQVWFGARLQGWLREGISARAAFGFVAAVVVLVAAYAVAFESPLPEVPGSFTLVSYSLSGAGILLLGLSQEPLRVGLGLLTFLSGFDLFYVALEPSLVVTGLLGSISFVIALGMAYVRTARPAARDEGEVA